MWLYICLYCCLSSEREERLLSGFTVAQRESHWLREEISLQSKSPQECTKDPANRTETPRLPRTGEDELWCPGGARDTTGEGPRISTPGSQFACDHFQLSSQSCGTVSGHFQRPKEHTRPRVPLEAGGAGGALLGTAPALPSKAVRLGSRLSRRLSQSD